MTKTTQPETGKPRRLRWSVPAADVSVHAWLDLQHDISISLRLLIRQSIEREGYTDVVNKPVEQAARHVLTPHPGAEESRPPDTAAQQSLEASADPPASRHTPADQEPRPAPSPAKPQASIDEIMAATRR